MTIGIAIPTHPTHVGYVYNLLEQINKSSILPNQVSISISEFSGDLLIKEYPFEVIVSKSTEPKMASQNRNIAGSKLQTDIISFMDADDIPHIRRNEFLLKSFDLGAKSVVHDYIYTGLSITHYSDELNEFNFIIDTIDTYGGGAHLTPISSTINGYSHSNGHITVLKSIFDNHKYDESEWLHRCCEDSEFAGKLVLNGYKISLLKNKLSLYRK